MLKAHRKTLIIASVVTILPVLIGIVLWNRLPDRMAIHFGINNEADGFSSRALAVLGLPLFLLAAEWIGAFVMANDPKMQNIAPKLFSFSLWIVPVVSLVMAAAVYSYNLGYRVNFIFVVELLLGVMFIIIGNYLPKARQNYTMGIKIPWTLANEENWNLTHRLAGYLWVIAGILMVIAVLAGVGLAAWLMPVVALTILIPCIYSYWLHVKKNL